MFRKNWVSLGIVLVLLVSITATTVLMVINKNNSSQDIRSRAQGPMNLIQNGDFENGLSSWVLCGGDGVSTTIPSESKVNYTYSRQVSPDAAYAGKNGFSLMVSESGRQAPNNVIAGICQFVQASVITLRVKPLTMSNDIYSTFWVEAEDTLGSIGYSYNTAGNFWTGDIKGTLSLNNWSKLTIPVASDYQRKYGRQIGSQYVLKIWGRADEGTVSLNVDEISGSNGLYPAKAAAFDDGGTSGKPVPYQLYNDLHLDYVYGGYNQVNLDFVKAYGAKQWIPRDTSYNLDWTPYAVYGSPDYVACFNEDNGGYHPAWDETTTENYLVKCINNYKSVWPNTKIIVNLGAQDNNAATNAVFFPAWPNSVWGAFARHLSQIDGFGIHLYPENCPPASAPPGYQYGLNSDDTKFLGCTENYIQIAKNFLHSKGADSKFLAFTEWGISDVNANNARQDWRSTALWQKFWDMLRDNNIELFSVYATVWRYDNGTLPGFPGGLVDPLTNQLTPYGQAYSQMQQQLPSPLTLNSAASPKKLTPTPAKKPAWVRQNGTTPTGATTNCYLRLFSGKTCTGSIKGYGYCQACSKNGLGVCYEVTNPTSFGWNSADNCLTVSCPKANSCNYPNWSVPSSSGVFKNATSLKWK